MSQITFPNKNTGDTFSATEANEIKTVVNTNDTATATALGQKENTSNKGQANGYAALDSNSRVPLINSSIINTPTPSTSNIIATDGLQEIANKTQGRLSAIESAIAILNATTSRRRGTFANKSIIGFQSRLPVTSGLSNGTDTTETSKFVYKSIGAVSDIEVLFTNFEGLNVTTQVVANDITIEASIEYPAGTFTRLTFDGGNTSTLIKRGQTKKTDVFLGYIPANTAFWIRTNVLVTSGQVWQKNQATNGNSGALGIEGVVTGSNLVMSGTINQSTGFCYGPVAVIGISSSNNGSILLRGDSISIGSGDSGFASYGFSNNGGMFNRAFSPNFPNLIGNFAGQKLSQWLKTTGYNSTNFYDQLLSTCQFAISNLGINDVATDTVAQMQVSFLQNAYLDKAKGIKSWQTTITPRTTSTDGWTTTTNQTPTAKESVRVGFNDWLRDGCPLDVTTQVASTTGATGTNIIRIGDARHPVEGVFELADIAETSRNSGIWKVQAGPASYTADGLHPNAAMYILLSAGIDITKFKV